MLLIFTENCPLTDMPKIGGFQSLKLERRMIAGFEAMLWFRTGFSFTGDYTVNFSNSMPDASYSYACNAHYYDGANAAVTVGGPPRNQTLAAAKVAGSLRIGTVLSYTYGFYDCDDVCVSIFR